MKILELFSGTQSISKRFKEAGHEVFTVELDPQFSDISSLTMNVLDLTSDLVLLKFGRPDVIWASPPCEKFSIASCSHHWIKEGDVLTPRHDDAILAQELVKHTLKLIEELQPTVYFIENPRGMLRKMPFMQEANEKGRHTVTYCQYGDNRMKPTDLWTNHPDPQFKPMCKNGMPCHESAPRGSKTGTQGRKTYRERSMIPAQLGEHIVKISEKVVNK